MQSEVQALRRELARFERRARAVSLAGLAAVMMAVVLGIGARQAQSQSASLSARGVVLVDASGRPRIVLGTDANNRPGIRLLDEAGKDRLVFGLDAGRGFPQVFLADEGGRRRFGAEVSFERGGAEIVLFDAAGTSRADFGFDHQLGTPRFALGDEHGRDRIYAGWTRDGTTLNVFDDSGAVIWRVAAP